MFNEKYQRDYICEVVKIVKIINREHNKIIFEDINGETHTILNEDNDIIANKKLVLAKIEDEVLAYTVVKKNNENKITSIIREDECLWEKYVTSKFIIINEEYKKSLIRSSKISESKRFLIFILFFIIAILLAMLLVRNNILGTGSDIVNISFLLSAISTVFMGSKFAKDPDHDGLYSNFKSDINQQLHQRAFEERKNQ